MVAGMRRLFACALLLAACHHTTRKTLEPEVPTNGNPAARSKFADAKAKFLRDGTGLETFEEIAHDFPNDPILHPWAELYEGISAVKARKLDVADRALSHVIALDADKTLTLRAEMFLGIAKNYEGDTAGARALLVKSDKGVENDDERTEYLAAYAYAFAAGDRPLSALRTFDELYGRSRSGITPTERAVLLDRVDGIVAAATGPALEGVSSELDKKGPSYAFVATRLAQLAAQRGDTAAAQSYREAANAARAAVGLPKAQLAVQAPAGPSGILGAVLPLGVKKQARTTDSAVVSLGLVTGATGGTGVTAIEMRAAADPGASAAAVDELGKTSVVAIVGPIDDDSVDAAAKQAEADGIPLLSLASRPEDRVLGKFVFHIRHSPVARAKILARQAIAKGVTKFFVMAAETGYGRAVAKAFAAEVAAGGGSIAGTVTYPADTKSFANQAGKLAGNFDGVFVADNAEHLELIVPALATAGFFPKPLGTKKVVGGRPVLLLSTAEGLSAQYVANAGRYSEGAMLAPGYYPDQQDARSKAFVDGYAGAGERRALARRRQEAYAYDAAMLAAARRPGRTRGRPPPRCRVRRSRA